MGDFQYTYQSGAAAQFMVAESAEGGEGRGEEVQGARAPRGRNVVPVEVRRLLQHGGVGPLFIGGLEVGWVQVVGQVRRRSPPLLQVRHVEERETSTAYQVEDRTGRIEVVQWHLEEERAPAAEVSSLVKVVGELRGGREQPLVTAFRVSAVSGLAEADCHLLQVVLVPLRQHKMEERAAALAQGTMPGPRRHAPAPAPRAVAVLPRHGAGDWMAPAPAPALEPAALQLLATIRASREPMGASREELAARVGRGRLEGLLDLLAVEGHIYTTCDQDHFMSTDA